MKAIFETLRASDTKQGPRLALVMMALKANHLGDVTLSAADLGEMCNTSKQAAATNIRKLIASGDIEVKTQPAGSVPGTYNLPHLKCDPALTQAITKMREVLPHPKDVQHIPIRDLSQIKAKPAPVEVKTQQAPADAFGAAPSLKVTTGSAEVSSLEVTRIMKAAGAFDPAQPLYWARREHRAAVDAILAQLACTPTQLVQRIQQALKEGAAPIKGARSVDALRGLLG